MPSISAVHLDRRRPPILSPPMRIVTDRMSAEEEHPRTPRSRSLQGAPSSPSTRRAPPRSPDPRARGRHFPPNPPWTTSTSFHQSRRHLRPLPLRAPPAHPPATVRGPAPDSPSRSARGTCDDHEDACDFDIFLCRAYVLTCVIHLALLSDHDRSSSSNTRRQTIPPMACRLKKKGFFINHLPSQH
jgi:hypothetical protein